MTPRGIGRALLLAATLLVGSAALVTSSAVDTKPAPVVKEVDPKVRMKSLITESLKVGDLWTALQADAYASQKLGVRSAGILGNSEIIGDPLFAFPTRIINHFQRGDQVIVVAGQRIYRLATDGRPLAVSLAVPFVPHAAAVSVDGAFIAVAERQRHPAWALNVHVRNLITGAEVMTATHPLISSDYIHGEVQIAPDGSAVMVGVLNDNGSAGPRAVVLRAGGKHVAVPRFYRPVAIAADGAWGIAEPASNLAGEERHYALLHGGNALICRAVAAGPGVAALIEEEKRDTVQVVAQDGTRTPLQLPHALGTSPQLLSTGEWLVVASGWPRQAQSENVVVDELDLLGESASAPAASAQPYTSWFYRWTDLAAGAAAVKPAVTALGLPAISSLKATTVFVANDTQVQVVDLAVEKPEAKPLMTAVGRVSSIEARHGRVLLRLREDKGQVIDEGGADLWNGAAYHGVRIYDPWFASVRNDDGSVAWVRLSATPAERLNTRLAIPAGGGYDLELDRYHRHLLAVRSRSEWVEFEVGTGKTPNGIGIRPVRPQVVIPWLGSAPSLFTVQMARLIPKFAPPVVEDPASRWNPLDAWRVSGTLVVLDHHGQVHVAGRKKGTYQTLGSVDYPASFAQTTTGDLMVTSGDEYVARARLAAGPMLATAGTGIGQRSEPLPEGPWRVKGTFFVPPRAGSMMWDATRCGFTPMRLRSPPPPATGMLVITDSVIFDLDPAVGKQLGVIDKAGLRDADRDK